MKLARQHPLAVAVLALGLACAQGGSDSADPEEETEPRPQPNVLVVLLDDVGTDLIGSYAEHPDAVTLPVIDDLARKGVSFDNVWVEPVCSPTRAALLTGLHPSENGIGRITDTPSALSTDSFTTLPREARKEGYATFAVGKWHLAGRPAVDLMHPNQIGFDYFAGSMDNLQIDGRDYFSWNKVMNGVANPDHDVYATSDAVDEAIAQIQQLDSPWFGWVGFHAVHVPHHVPPDGLTYSTPSADPGRPERARLMLEALDIELGRLLRSLPGAEPTTVIVVGDNGTGGGVQTPPKVEGHTKGSLYQGGIRVPLIVQGYGVERAAEGRRSPALVHAPDLFASVTELFDGTPRETPSSRSFVPCLSDPESCAPREIAYAERFEPNNPDPGEVEEHRQAAREIRYKLIVERDGAEELYDLLADPDEISDLLPGPLTLEQQQAYERLRDEILPRRLTSP